MLSRHFIAISGVALLGLSACAQPPAPEVARATPLYSKSGAGLCVPSNPIPGTTYVPNAPNCDDVCESGDRVTSANVAVCPPVYDPGRRPQGGDDSSTQDDREPQSQDPGRLRQ